jgi:type III secretory pathway component EscU
MPLEASRINFVGCSLNFVSYKGPSVLEIWKEVGRVIFLYLLFGFILGSMTLGMVHIGYVQGLENIVSGLETATVEGEPRLWP